MGFIGWYFTLGLVVALGLWTYSMAVSRHSWFDTLVLMPLTVVIWPAILWAVLDRFMQRS
jgi:hypothetical protein